ncbi:MAG: two-component system sensor histidine kinase CreC [Lentisphaeraceae bacterium]|nr:two-component system sensor histidine kinase CreC [Lentisphaeraceae bacterium]
MFNFLTIKRRILLTFAILSSLAMYYFSNWVSDSTRRHYLEAAEEVMVDELYVLKQMIQLNTEKDADIPAIKRYKEIFHSLPNEQPKSQIYEVLKSSTDTYTYVTDSKGVVLYHSQNPEFEGASFLKWRNVFLALGGKYGARSTRGDKDDPTSSHMHVSLPLIVNDKLLGAVTLVKPVKSLSVYLDLSRKRVTKIAIFTLILILLLGFLLMRRIVNPIEDLTDYTSKISKGERPELPKLPKGEMDLLGKTIEKMMRTLDGKSYIESYIRGLTHELKSPIAAIKGASELIESEKLSDEEKKLLKNINIESDRMSEMVQKLLLLSRIENQSFSENLEIINLKTLIEEIVDEAQERYSDREFKFICHFPQSIKGDRLLIKAALSNLLSNACDFSDKAIEVELKCNDKITVTVKDEGCGIPDYALDKVFQRFYSLPRPNSGSKSSGLGLSIVQEVVNLHGGQVRVQNRAETGTIVTMDFPLTLRH